LSFNTDALSLLALGIRGDPPVGPQPRLPDGVHLRWSPDPVRGFPWYGFYLFRRESRPSRPRCLSVELRRFRPGTSQSLRLETPLGRLSSAKPLVFSDDFPATGLVEVDLDQGAPLRFDLPAGVEARRVDVRIGLRDAGPQTVRTCADFRGLPLGAGRSPRTEKGAVFAATAPPVSPFVAVTSIEQWPGGATGLQTTRRLEIAIPCPATRVDLLLTNRGELRIEALSADGASAGVREIPRLTLKAGIVTLTGQGIVSVTIESSTVDPALLHEVCWECATTRERTAPEIEVRALGGAAVLARTIAKGNVGEVVGASLEGAGITAVEIAAGPAALVDLCFLISKQPETFGWDELKGFTYPLCLPVAHTDYPCPSKPATFDKAHDLALSRVTYPAPVGWDTGFVALHGQLEILVKGGPGGGPMAGRINPDLIGPPLGPAPGLERLKVPKQRPLDLVLLASLQPAMAQMLGLYFADTSAEVGVPYDYLLLADPTGVLGGSAATALEWLAFTADSDAADGYLATGKSVPSMPAPPVPPPGPARAYALPGAIMRSQTGDLVDAQANAGLWWQPSPPKPVGGSPEKPNLPVLYYPWRASLGLNRPPPTAPPPPDAKYQPVLRPADPQHPTQPPRPLTVLLAAPASPPTNPAPSSPEWPPPPISFHIVDSGLAEGWYSYRIVGQDIFGRHSALGSPAEWYQWDPPLRTPPVPLPWYYEKGSPGHHSIHPFAVALLDKIPPPRPTGLEATCLDPDDRWVLRDEPYEIWRAAHLTAVGLRVSWRWTLAHMNQAPDTREFRLYYQPGRLNELPGGIGVDDLSRPTAWAQRLSVVGYNEHVELQFEASRDPQGQMLASSISRASGKVVRLAGNPDLSGVQPFLDHLRLDRDSVRPDRTYKILELDVMQRTVTLDGIPSLGQDSPWTIGRPVRQYEVFLAPPVFAPGAEFEPTLADPTVFAQIGISAADDKVHTADDPHWGVPASHDRFGNEGSVGGPAAIFRVLQTPPAPPELPDYPDRLLATPADYHSNSFFTFRWKVPTAGPGLKVHVLRALDDSLFQRDLLIRETREALDPVLHEDHFPEAWKLEPNPSARRQAAATAVKGIEEKADYLQFSDDAWIVLALLPGNEGISSGIGPEGPPATQRLRSALTERDWAVRSTRKAFLATAPPSFSARTLAAYDKLSDLALRVLAGLPGNEDAFAQITLEPLDDSTEPSTSDRRGPDDPEPPWHQVLPDVRAYLDTLPGRATNRYFYRAVCVDRAHNRSGLSLSTPPVYLPKVTPPRAPVIAKVTGGEREITIEWEPSPEPDVVEYRLYRASTPDEASDDLRMKLVHNQSATVTSGERPLWTDKPLPGRTTYFYRVLAQSSSGLLSEPSTAVAAQAYDQTPPEPPTWVAGSWKTDGSGIDLQWSVTGPGLETMTALETMVLRRSGNAWYSVSPWLRPGIAEFLDSGAPDDIVNQYRLRVRNYAGNLNVKYLERTVELQ
jgi:hypothetical protein